MEVLCVTEENVPTGFCEKQEAHKTGALHRAFSVLIFNSKGEMLLQRRADCKYHSPGKWSNTACGHPLGKDIKEEATTRLFEEMGINTGIDSSYTFHYTEKVGNLWENEIDEVFVGTYDGELKPDPEEVSDYKWVDVNELRDDMERDPDIYSRWFQIIMRDNKF